MTTLNIDTPVGDLVTERPSRSRVFSKVGIDFCCGGKMSLAEACAKKGLDPQVILEQLQQEDQQTSSMASSRVDPDAMTLTDLADHVQHTHHAYLKQELPRLGAMVRKVAAVHGQHHPWTIQIDEVYTEFAKEMEAHMLKEEHMLFPMIRQLDALAPGAGLPAGMGVAAPIKMMEHEHDSAGDGLEKIHEYSNGFTPPEDACNTFRAMLDGLKYLEEDTHQHVHKENNILFPKSIAMEAQKKSTGV